MSEEEPFSLPDTVTAAVIKYVRETHGIHLYPELLIGLYGELTAHRRAMTILAKTDPSFKNAAGFRAAMVHVMDRHYTQSDEQERRLYQALSSALGRIGHELKQRRAKPRLTKAHTPLERLMNYVVVDQGNPQSRFAF